MTDPWADLFLFLAGFAAVSGLFALLCVPLALANRSRRVARVFDRLVEWVLG